MAVANEDEPPTKPLPPYTGPDAPCIACGQRAVSTEYKPWFWEYSRAGLVYGRWTAHLVRSCQNCGRGWVEATVAVGTEEEK